MEAFFVTKLWATNPEVAFLILDAVPVAIYNLVFSFSPFLAVRRSEKSP